MKRKSRMWITLVPIIAVVIAIFCFSAQSKAQSNEKSDPIVDSVITGLPGYSEMTGSERWELRHTVIVVVRKAAHVTEYAALGFFTYLHAHFSGSFSEKTKMLASLGFCAFYGATDEIHQYFVPGRFSTALDVLIDTGGALIGILLLCLLLAVCRGRKKNG